MLTYPNRQREQVESLHSGGPNPLVSTKVRIASPHMGYADPERQRQYQREWTATRKAEWLRTNGPCVDCGSWSDLEVDHVNPAEKVTHHVWSWSEGRRSAELAKCVVRCHPCHAIKTAMHPLPPHGTIQRYWSQKAPCRQECCKKANRDYRAQRRSLGFA